MISFKTNPIPPPTIFFVKPEHLESVVASIAREASRSFILYPFARRHKLANISEGFITKESLWDRLVYDSARAKVLGDGANAVRGVIVSGGEEAMLRYPSSTDLIPRTPERFATDPCENGAFSTAR
jgi:long-chain acyl-CoA synthetase